MMTPEMRTKQAVLMEAKSLTLNDQTSIETTAELNTAEESAKAKLFVKLKY